MLSVGAKCFEGRFCASTKGGIGGGGRVSAQKIVFTAWEVKRSRHGVQTVAVLGGGGGGGGGAYASPNHPGVGPCGHVPCHRPSRLRTSFVTQDRKKSTNSVQGAVAQESIDSIEGEGSTVSVKRPTTQLVPSSR